MKYFTQELIVQGQIQDDQVVDKVEAAWDENSERYAAYLDSIRNQLPPGLRRRIDTYYLHDAVIRGMGREGNSFVIILQLDTPPQSILTLTYDLLSEPEIRQNTLPAELCARGTAVDWQYDEIEMVPGEAPTWRQAVLLSNGWELNLHFRDISVQEVQALIPAPRNGTAGVTPLVPQHTAAH
jgi:hypothetical protein